MFCPRCGSDLPGDATFCDRCGGEVAAGGPGSKAPMARAQGPLHQRIEAIRYRWRYREFLETVEPRLTDFTDSTFTFDNGLALDVLSSGRGQNVAFWLFLDATGAVLRPSAREVQRLRWAGFLGYRRMAEASPTPGGPLDERLQAIGAALGRTWFRMRADLFHWRPHRPRPSGVPPWKVRASLGYFPWWRRGTQILAVLDDLQSLLVDVQAQAPGP